MIQTKFDPELSGILHPKPIKKVTFDHIGILVREKVKFYSENMSIKKKEFNTKGHMSAMANSKNPEKRLKKANLLKEKQNKFGLNFSIPESTNEPESQQTNQSTQDTLEESTKTKLSMAGSPFESIDMKKEGENGYPEVPEHHESPIPEFDASTNPSIQRCSNPMKGILPKSNFQLLIDSTGLIEESSQEEGGEDGEEI